MRQLVIGILLLILIFSVALVFLKPTPKQEITPDTTSHASKLLQPKEQEVETPIQIKEPTSNNETDKMITDKLNTELKKQTATNPQGVEKSLDKAENNKDLNKIKQELAQKYNNNPDAEISEEDLMDFLQKASKVNINN